MLELPLNMSANTPLFKPATPQDAAQHKHSRRTDKTTARATGDMKVRESNQSLLTIFVLLGRI